MKKRFKKLVNKNLKWILIIGIVIVLALGVLLVLISGNDDDRDQVPIDPTAEQSVDKKDKKDRKLAESTDHPGVSDVALDLYNARVDDISDTAAVAQLLEASEMREELGNYLVTLKLKDGEDTLIIAFEKKLLKGEDATFDEAATWYAEQFLCLIEEADVVKWTYSIESDVTETTTEEKDKEDSDKEESETEATESGWKEVEKSLTVNQATELLQTDVKSYSETPELVQTLLNNQKGIV